MRNRLIVSFVGIPGLLLLIWLGGWPYFALITAIVLLGTREYLDLLKVEKLATRDIPLYLASIALLMLAANESGLLRLSWIPDYNTGAVFLAVVLILTLQTWEVARSPDRAWLGIGAHLVGFVWIAGFMSAFILVRQYNFGSFAGDQVNGGFRLTVALFISVWICDSAAYFFGKAFGKAKIAPQVSPNKTVVGTAAGLVGAIITMQLFGLRDLIPGLDVADYLALGVITGAFGQLGDFVESRLKRDFGVKDSGTLLPGHGGILDRFDSLLYVMPITFIYMVLFVH